MKIGKKRLIFIGLAVVILAGVAGATVASFSDPETSTSNVVRVITSWYDLAWGYRKPVTLTNGGGALTNYQLRMTIDTQTPVGAGKMRSDGNDIRFTSSDGTTSLDYWIESGMPGLSTVIWVEVNSIPSGSSTIYMYYGNSSAAAASNGYNTFIFFDDFEDDLTRWTKSGTGTYTRVNTQQTHGSWSMQLSNVVTVYASFTAQTQAVVEWDARPAQTNLVWEEYVATTNKIGPYLQFNSDATIEYKTNKWSDFSPAVSYSANTWYSYKLDNVNCSPDTYDAYIGGSLRGSGVSFSAGLTSFERIYFVSASASSAMYVDMVKVRGYAATEPGYSVGSEE